MLKSLKEFWNLLWNTPSDLEVTLAALDQLRAFHAAQDKPAQNAATKAQQEAIALQERVKAALPGECVPCSLSELQSYIKIPPGRSKSMTKLEEVARALYAHENQNISTWEVDAADPGPIRDYWFDAARAAIAAMRAPSEAMLKAAYALHESDTFWDNSTAPPRLCHKLGRAGVKEDWQAMIDSALSEPIINSSNR